MTASQISKLLRGKRIGHGRYLAKCPAHPDNHPSLNIRDGKKCVLLKCWPGCTPEQIVSAMGLRMSDLWYESRSSISEEANSRLNDERLLEDLERLWGLVIWLKAVEPLNHYWEALEHKLAEDRKQLILKLYPARKAAYDLQVKIRSVGWDAMCEEYFRGQPIVEAKQEMLFEVNRVHYDPS
jgi:hypothetical protein